MKIYRMLMLCVLFMVMNSGCRKFVEVDAPDNLLVNGNVYANDETAIAAMTGIYAEMMFRDNTSMPYQIPVLTGLYGDELETGSPSLKPAYDNTLFPLDAPTNTTWTFAYSWIFQANLVYEGCQKSNSLNPLVKKQLMAEAALIRSYWYFYLLNLWGDIPMPLTSSYKDNATIAKSNTVDVYNQIIKDLQYAQAELNDKYVAANSVAVSTDRVRPCKAVATALLSRVYLFTKDYGNAEIQASQVLQNKADYDLVALNGVFLKNSKEAIWQLMTPVSSIIGYLTPENFGFSLIAPPGTTINNSCTVGKYLWEAFDSTDKRRSEWIGNYTDTKVTPNKVYNFPNKYKVSAGASTEASTVIRVAELYLIRAESRAQQNNLLGAIADLDMVRKRAGITLIAETNPGISKDALLNAILKERRRELFSEWGHRWLDLKRTGNLNVVMADVATYKNTTWSAYKQHWPIPKRDIDRNTSLKQNEGYNN